MDDTHCMQPLLVLSSACLPCGNGQAFGIVKVLPHQPIRNYVDGQSEEWGLEIGTWLSSWMRLRSCR